MIRTSIPLRLLIAALFCLPLLAAQSKKTAEDPATLSVHGESTVSVEPDLAELDVGVLTQAQTAQAAADQGASKTKQIISQLQHLVASTAMRSVNVSVNPNYRYAKDGGAGVVTGYTASNTIRVVVTDLSQLRKVIESATQAGASSINRLTFDLSDEKAVRARALAQAATQAQAGAEALAASLKLRIERLIRVEEVQPVVISPAREVEVSALQQAVPDQAALAPGTIQIHASVNLVYTVRDR